MLDKIKIDKNTLIQIIKENLKKHNAKYDQEIKNYKEKCREELSKWMARIDSEEWQNNPTSISIYYTVPGIIKERYENFLKALELTKDVTIELSINDFNKYVLDINQ